MNDFPTVSAKNYDSHSKYIFNFRRYRELRFKFLHYRTKFISLNDLSDYSQDAILYNWKIRDVNNKEHFGLNNKEKFTFSYKLNTIPPPRSLSENEELTLKNGSLEIK